MTDHEVVACRHRLYDRAPSPVPGAVRLSV